MIVRYTKNCQAKSANIALAKFLPKIECLTRKSERIVISNVDFEF
jgi:hypothetical protein